MSSSKSRFKPRPRAKPKPSPKPKPKPKPKPTVKEEPQSSKRIKTEGPIRSSRRSDHARSGRRSPTRTRSKGRGPGEVKKEHQAGPKVVAVKKEEDVLPVAVELKVEKKEEDDDDVMDVEETVEKQVEKEKEEAKKDELEWAQVEDLWQLEDDNLDPLTVPFVPEKYRRVNHNLSELFPVQHTEHEGHVQDRNKTVLVQLPRHLPFKTQKQAVDKVKKEPVKTEPGVAKPNANADVGHDASGNPNSLPPGKVGKLRVHKSGRTTLLIGDNLFELSPGYNCSFQEEVCAIQEKTKSLVSLSKLDGRVICMPNIDFALNKCKLNPSRTVQQTSDKAVDV